MAHHALSAEFDGNRPLQLEGTVTKMEWINPHAWINIDATKDDGSTESWMIEGGTPNAFFRRGFTKDSLQPGTEIMVDLTFKDGRKLFMGSSGTGAPRDGRDPTARLKSARKRPD